MEGPYVAFTLLNEKNLPVSELAERLGYQSEAPFNRAFKRIIGVSPSVTRQGGSVTQYGAQALRAVVAIANVTMTTPTTAV